MTVKDEHDPWEATSEGLRGAATAFQRGQRVMELRRQGWAYPRIAAEVRPVSQEPFGWREWTPSPEQIGMLVRAWELLTRLAVEPEPRLYYLALQTFERAPVGARKRLEWEVNELTPEQRPEALRVRLNELLEAERVQSPVRRRQRRAF